MKTINKWILFAENLSFKYKIAIVFTIFCAAQTIIMSAIFFRQNIETLRSHTATQLLSVVQTKNEIVDMRLQSISDSILLLNFDSKLFEIYDSYDKYSLIDRLAVPGEMQSLFFRYFSDAQDIYSINLLSSRLSLSNKPYHFEYADFIQSPVLYRPENDRNFSQYWIPRFNIRQFVEEINPIGNVRYGFATVKRLNLTTLYKTSFITLSSLVERPYVLIVFDESFFRKYYENATGFKESEYLIISPNAEIISGSHGPVEQSHVPPWFEIAKEKQNGIAYVQMNGEETLVCFTTSAKTGWITAITTPVRSLTLNAASTQRQLIVMSLLLAAMMLIFYFKSAAFLAKPIKQLKLNEKKAKIAILNAQLKPHFIYNTLNTINWMAVEHNQADISKMVVSLASILQYTFRDYEIIVHFSEEVNWLEQYLFIMSNRFHGKFVVNYDIDPVLYNCYVPKLLLQPLVENSIVHGFRDRSAGGIITISGWISEDELYFSITDNGCGIPEERLASILNDENSSIGCRNVDNKLKLIYGEEYGIQMTSAENRGTTITVRMPVRYEK